MCDNSVVPSPRHHHRIASNVRLLTWTTKPMRGAYWWWQLIMMMVAAIWVCDKNSWPRATRKLRTQWWICVRCCVMRMCANSVVIFKSNYSRTEINFHTIWESPPIVCKFSVDSPVVSNTFNDNIKWMVISSLANIARMTLRAQQA